jgi:hypothetical protein
VPFPTGCTSGGKSIERVALFLPVTSEAIMAHINFVFPLVHRLSLEPPFYTRKILFFSFIEPPNPSQQDLRMSIV